MYYGYSHLLLLAEPGSPNTGNTVCNGEESGMVGAGEIDAKLVCCLTFNNRSSKCLSI